MDKEEACHVMVHQEGPHQTPPVEADPHSSSSLPIKRGCTISNHKKWVLLAMATTGIALAVGLGVGLSKKDEESTMVEICHFPPDNKSNFTTLDVAQNTVAAHLEHGDLMGSCEENCLDICFGEDSALNASSIPVQECVQRCRPDWSSGVAVAVSGSTPALEIVSCDNSTVVIQGLRVSDIVPGFFFISLSGDIPLQCSSCNLLFRMVDSVTNGTAGTKILSTTFATLGDILGKDTVKPLLRDEPVELVAGCPDSNVDSGRNLVADDRAPHRQLQSFPSHCDLWPTTDDNGQCLYTRCFVGKDVDPYFCFECYKNCTNGCGSSELVLGYDLSFDGNFTTFDFGEPCCNHDYCWGSSVFTREECDSKFLDDMRAQCRASFSLSTLAGKFQFFLPFNPAAAPGIGTGAATCEALALSFYSLVSGDLFGTEIYLQGQAKQEAYEEHCGAEKDSPEPTPAPLF